MMKRWRKRKLMKAPVPHPIDDEVDVVTGFCQQTERTLIFPSPVTPNETEEANAMI